MPASEKIEVIEAIIGLIRQIPDPYAWGNSFRQSYRQYKGDSELIELAKECTELSSALYDLERNPSYFLYDVVPNKALYELTDEQLRDPEILKRIVSEVRKFEDDYKAVRDAFSAVEKRAYKKLGNVIVELGKSLDQRGSLLKELTSVVSERREPDEIREIGRVYQPLISSIQPLREEIRLFVDQHS